jgi:hypothetical protein
MALSPFDVLKAINETKENLFEDESSDIDRNYNSFIINRGLSLFPDTVFYANEMNRYPDIPKKWQFDYYMNVVSKKKRFSKWAKKEVISEELELVQTYYGYSKEKALSALTILTLDQLAFIKQSQYKGGRS